MFSTKSRCESAPYGSDYMAIRTGWQGDEVRSVSRLEAKLKAESEYEVFRHKQDAEYISDFDKEIKRLKGDS